MQNQKQRDLNLFALFAGLVGFFLAFKSVGDLDFWWHLSTGRWILEHKQFVESDFLSYTFKDAPWMDLTWGFEVIQYWLYSLTQNYWLVSFFFGTLGFLTGFFTFKVTADLQEEESSPLLLFLLCAVGLFLVEFRWIHRPEQFTHLFGILLIFILVKDTKQKSSLVWFIPLIQIAWVNTHGLFLLGLGITGLFLVQKVLKEGTTDLMKRVFNETLFKVLLVQMGACLINPRGWEGATFPFHLWEVLNHPFYRTTIPEATNPFKDGVWATDTWSLVIYSVLLVAAFVYPFKKEDCKKKLTYYGVGYLVFILLLFRLSVIARRNIALYVLWSLPIFSAAVAASLEKSLPKFSLFLQNLKPLKLASIATLIICLGFGTNAFRSEMSNSRFGGEISSFEFPTEAVEKLKSLGTLPRFFGGVQFSDFMGFHAKGYEPYLDGRFAEVYPREHFQKYMDILAHPRLIESEIERYKITAMGLETRTPMVHGLIRYMSMKPDWSLFYLDESAVIFLKSGTSAGNRTLADQMAKTRMEKILAGKDWNLFSVRSQSDKALGLTRLSETLILLGENAMANESLLMATKIEQDYPPAVSMMCVTAFSLLEERVSSVGNNPEKLSAILAEEASGVEEKCRKAKKYGADRTSALFTSALLHLNLGRYNDSVREFSELVKRDPLSPQGHQLLGRSLAAMGRLDEAETSYLESSRLRPYEGESLMELAQIFEMKGDAQKAKFYKTEASARMERGSRHP